MKEKDSLYAYCMNYVQERITRTQEEISKVQSSANEETKSSAGDKYETGRAMAQLEIERNTTQLSEAKKLQATMQSLNATRASDVVIPGSLVTTSKGMFYIAISMGIVEFDRQKYFVVSVDSPIGKLLMGKKAGDIVTWNNQPYAIQSVE